MAKGVGGGGRGGRAGGSALARMMPTENRKDLGIVPGGGLPKGFEGQVAYNPKTGTLVAGRRSHAEIIAGYTSGQRYDDFVKMYVLPIRGRTGRQLYIDVDRITGRDNATKWDTAFRAARSLRSAGLTGDVTVRLDFGGRTAQYVEISGV